MPLVSPASASSGGPARGELARPARNALLWGLGLVLLGASWFPADHYPPWLGFHAELLAGAGLLSLLFAVLSSGARTQAVPRLALGVACLALLPGLQWLGGIYAYGGDALLSTLYLGLLAAAIAVGFQVASQPTGEGRAMAGLMHVLWLSALGSAAIGLLQWFGMGHVFTALSPWIVDRDAAERAAGNLGQPNQLATLLLMGLASLACIHQRRVIGRLGFVVAAGFLTLGLALTQSRTALLSALAVAAFLAWKGKREELGLRRSAIGLWVLLFVGLFFACPYVGELLHLGSGRATALADNAPRWRLWQQVVLGILDSPWWGYGWNQSGSAHMAGARLLPGTLTLSYAHNIMLDLLAWCGIPLGLLAIFGCTYWTASRLRRCQGPRAVFAMACLLPILVHSLLEYPFAYAYFLLFAGMMAGIVEAQVAPKAVRAIRSGWLWALAAAASVAGACIAYEYLLIESDFRVVRFEGARIGFTPASHTPPHVRLNTHLGEMLRAARIQPRPGMPAHEVEQLGSVARRFPYRTLSLHYALALGFDGQTAKAGAEMRQIRNLYGEVEYAIVKAEWDRYAGIYPQLNQVSVP